MNHVTMYGHPPLPSFKSSIVKKPKTHTSPADGIIFDRPLIWSDVPLGNFQKNLLVSVL